MDKLRQLLEYIRITNPDMTMERLIKELSLTQYSTRSLINTYKQIKNPHTM